MIIGGYQIISQDETTPRAPTLAHAMLRLIEAYILQSNNLVG
jgi:hypothetical protein